MAVTSLLSPSKSKLLMQLAQQLPEVVFTAGESFYWSPESKTISYVPATLENNQGIWSLLHEAGHALHDHSTYRSDFELLQLELDAWEAAKQLGEGLQMSIDEDYLQDCLDTYRDWLHRRSTCPTCGTNGLQSSPSLYQCYNCTASWSVTSSRFCRAYRQKTIVAKSTGTPSPKTFQ